MKVLEAINTGTEENLYDKNLRNDSIKFTPWMDEIKKFVLSEENSRAVPGQETVSIRYNVRKEKYVLQKSKYEIAKAFKELHPDCLFKTSTLIREFPQNAVTPTNRDMERNRCPTHTNVRQLVKSLHKIGVAKELPISCRGAAWEIMCKDKDGVNVHQPVSWNKDCAYSDCTNCPQVNLKIPKTYTHGGKQKPVPKLVTFSQWEKAHNPQKGKKTFSLVKHTINVNEAVDQLVDMLPELKRHIYASHNQWHAHSTYRNNLSATSVITIEDYQQNMEIVYSEMPTTTAYSGNKASVAMYPIVFEYIDDDTGELQKIANVFMSDDKQHDHQQVIFIEFLRQ